MSYGWRGHADFGIVVKAATGNGTWGPQESKQPKLKRKHRRAIDYDRQHEIESVLYNYTPHDYVTRLHLIDPRWWKDTPLKGVDGHDEQWWRLFSFQIGYFA